VELLGEALFDEEAQIRKLSSAALKRFATPQQDQPSPRWGTSAFEPPSAPKETREPSNYERMCIELGHWEARMVFGVTDLDPIKRALKSSDWSVALAAYLMLERLHAPLPSASETQHLVEVLAAEVRRCYARTHTVRLVTGTEWYEDSYSGSYSPTQYESFAISDPDQASIRSLAALIPPTLLPWVQTLSGAALGVLSP
jgi:hypothetical protein